MSSQVHVVIIGASFAGIPIAHSLLKDIPTVKVTLINPSPTFYFTIAAPRILAKRDAFKPEQYLLPIEKEFSRYPTKSFEFVQGRVSAIDVSAKTVSLDTTRNISFDYLVIASGSTTASTSQKTAVPIPFKQSDSDDMKSMIHNAQDSIRMAESIVIAGAGPIGVEVAGEIAEAARQSGRKVKITLVSASYRILPMLKPAGSAAAEKLLTGLGVEIVKNQKVAEAVQSKESHLWTVTLDEGRKLDVDLYIPTTGVLPNNDFIPADLLDENGWVVVDKELRVKTRRGSVARLPIFAAGDITNNSMRLSFKAQEQAAIVAANLKAEIVRQGKTKTYDQGDKTMMVVPVGSTGGTGLIMGWTPWSAMVKMVKGKDFFISKAHSAVSAK
jgi:NADH dehydrogenase FAD-containing subunit